jgi:hypothetical protein
VAVYGENLMATHTRIPRLPRGRGINHLVGTARRTGFVL